MSLLQKILIASCLLIVAVLSQPAERSFARMSFKQLPEALAKPVRSPESSEEESKLEPLKDAPGSIYLLQQAQGLMSEDEGIPFHIVTSNEYPHYVTHDEARGFCSSLKGGWRLPEEGELYGLRSQVGTGVSLKSLDKEIQLSRGKYWTDTASGSGFKTVAMAETSTHHNKNPDSYHGVICVSGQF